MRFFRLAVTISILFAFTGCTVKYSFTGASIPPEAKTVSVKNFPNMAPLVNPLLSNEISETLKDRFMAETNLILTSAQGDLHFEGTITQYNTKPMDLQAGSDEAQQNRLTIGVKVKFVNTIEDKNSYEQNFSRFADYDSSQSLESVQDALVTEIVEQLVDDIFNKAVVNW